MIRFYEEEKIFMLQTKDTTYAFENLKGYLRSLYFGKRIDKLIDLPKMPFYISDNLSRFALDVYKYKNEFVGSGSAFYSDETLKVTFADGVRDLELLYLKHTINDNELVVTLKDKFYSVEVDVIYKVYYDVNIIDRSCVVRNTGTEPFTIENVASASVQIPYADEYYVTYMGSAWQNEFEIQKSKITKAAVVAESKAGYSVATNAPYFAVDDGTATESYGNVWFGALQWSGNWRISAVKNDMRETSITAGINSFDFTYVLNGGESFEAPILSCGFTDKGHGQASRNLHDYQRLTTKATYWKDKPIPILYNSWTAFEFDINEEQLCKLAERAADLGVELFVVDDGWFKGRVDDKAGLGDWVVDENKFPHGLNYLINKVNDLGLMFGIWIEPEMVNPDSDLYRAHPDWIINFPTRETFISRNQYVLNLAREDVYQYIENAMDNLLDKHNIGYLKFDMNRLITQAGWPEEENQQKLWYDYVKNFYRLLDHINEKHPKLLIENCAHGGGRADLAMTKWCARVNRSDNQDPVDMIHLHEGFTYLNLPRSAGGAGHISKRAIYKKESPMSFKAHAGMLGSLGISLDLNNVTEEEFNEVKSYVAFFKKIRNTVQMGDIYRLKSLRDSQYALYEYVSKDKKEAVLFMFGPSIPYRYCFPHIKLQGLNPDYTYEYDGGRRKTGYGLETVGMDTGVHIVGNLDSKVIVFKAVEE